MMISDGVDDQEQEIQEPCDENGNYFKVTSENICFVKFGSFLTDKAKNCCSVGIQKKAKNKRFVKLETAKQLLPFEQEAKMKSSKCK